MLPGQTIQLEKGKFPIVPTISQYLIYIKNIKKDILQIQMETDTQLLHFISRVYGTGVVHKFTINFHFKFPLFQHSKKLWLYR